jgi:hypothetical protein
MGANFSRDTRRGKFWRNSTLTMFDPLAMNDNRYKQPIPSRQFRQKQLRLWDRSSRWNWGRCSRTAISVWNTLWNLNMRVGQVVAKLGNNGQTRAPGIHIGAYREADSMPLQIRWDLRAMAKKRAEAGVK